MSSTTSQDTQVGRTIRPPAWGWALLALGLVGIGGLAIRKMDMEQDLEPCSSLTATNPSADLDIVTLLPVNFDGDNTTFLKLNDGKLGEANCTSGFLSVDGVLTFVHTLCCHGNSSSVMDIQVSPGVAVRRTGKFALNCKTTDGDECITTAKGTFVPESSQLTIHDDQSNHYALQMGGPAPPDGVFTTEAYSSSCDSLSTLRHPSDLVAAVLLLSV